MKMSPLNIDSATAKSRCADLARPPEPHASLQSDLSSYQRPIVGVSSCGHRSRTSRIKIDCSVRGYFINPTSQSTMARPGPRPQPATGVIHPRECCSPLSPDYRLVKHRKQAFLAAPGDFGMVSSPMRRHVPRIPRATCYQNPSSWSSSTYSSSGDGLNTLFSTSPRSCNPITFLGR